MFLTPESPALGSGPSVQITDFRATPMTKMGIFSHKLSSCILMFIYISRNRNNNYKNKEECNSAGFVVQ